MASGIERPAFAGLSLFQSTFGSRSDGSLAGRENRFSCTAARYLSAQARFLNTSCSCREKKVPSPRRQRCELRRMSQNRCLTVEALASSIIFTM
jgi:hypothetical protein